MKSHDDMLTRMRGANPLPHVDMISDEQLAALTLHIERTMRLRADSPPLALEPIKPGIGWWRPAAVFAAAVLAGLVAVGIVTLAANNDGTVRPPATAPTIAAGPPLREWSDLLATTKATLEPLAASCDFESLIGSATQEKPSSGWTGSLSGVFDNRRGRIIYVDSWQETWAFDVCTSTWAQLNPQGSSIEYPSGGLVYDVDSDVVVALGHEIAVYDPLDNAWAYPDAGIPTNPGVPFGGVYDPVSGLVVTTVYPEGGGLGARIEAWSYDVDSNEWSLLGVVAAEGEDQPWQYDLVGYSLDLDRLIFTPSELEATDHTLLIDPRSGDREIIWTPSPTVSLRWPRAHFGVGSGTTFVAGLDEGGTSPADKSGDLICGFDAESLSWSRCYNGPDRPLFGAFTWFGATVGDPINNRLVLIGGVFGEFGAMATGHVWGIDYGTGTVTELVADGP